MTAGDPLESTTDTSPTITTTTVRPATDLLAGFRIAVTSDRRSDDLIAALSRRGAQVMHAPALTIAPNQRDDLLVEQTRAIIAARPPVVLATTGYGVRRWFEVADAAGLGADLAAALEEADVYARGPKTVGALRAAGLDEATASGQETELETTASLVDEVARLAGSSRLASVAIQLHGHTDDEQLARLHDHVAQVLTVTPYRWTKPAGADKVPKMIEAACTGQLDLVTFTSAPAAEAVLAAARAEGLLADFVSALNTTVVAAAVGPVTAAPLTAAGIAVIQPDRFRMGALIRLVGEHLVTERTTEIPTALGTMVLRGRCVSLDAERVFLGPNALALFRALVEARGAVVSRAALLRTLPGRGDEDALDGDDDEHALEVSMSRLRRTLPVPAVIETVVKRGYRLALT